MHDIEQTLLVLKVLRVLHTLRSQVRFGMAFIIILNNHVFNMDDCISVRVQNQKLHMPRVETQLLQKIQMKELICIT